MLIRRIFLENFGLYQGRQEFDLIPREKYRRIRPIILFGGKNGAGKTTLLDGVRLALYGKTFLGPRVRQVDYEQFLHDRIHRSPKAPIQPLYAGVGLEFEHVIGGKREVYTVERSWSSKNGRGASESLSILHEGKPLEELDQEHWQSFIRDIVPEGISQLFFFDGEKIKSLAEDAEGTALAESIKALLGLDIVERLYADLSIYSSRAARRLGGDKISREVDAIEKNLEAKKSELATLGEDRASVEARIHGVEAEIRRLEGRLRSEGHAFAERREELKEERTRLLETIDQAEKTLRTECENLFPFAICPITSNGLREQLEAERELHRWMIVRDELRGIEDNLFACLAQPKVRMEIGLSEKGSSNLERFIRETLENGRQRPKRLDGVETVHEFSEAITEQILGWFNLAYKDATERVRGAATELERTHRSLQNVERDISRAPNDQVVLPIMEDLNERNRRLGALQQQAKSLDESIRIAQNDMETLERQREQFIKQCQDFEDVKTRFGLVRNVQGALQDYLTRITERKVFDLQQTVAECFNRLSRKGDVLQRIVIDPKTFSVILYDRHGTAIPKEELSSGEKQIYAISLLWGLGKTSHRALPVIVDTPLGRLDSDHRANLIQNYFPHAAHQVVILSTDTEVDQGLFKQINPDVSHSYHLVFDPNESRTVPVCEYFWKEPVNA